jgi:type IV pilus assembly protein PilC
MKNKQQRKPSFTDIAIFFRKLATLINSGIMMSQSCEILERSEENIQLKHMIHTLRHDMGSGQSFIESLKKFPEYFDEMTCQLLHIGMQSGTFAEMLIRVAVYKEKSLNLKKKIIQAFFYPTIILSIAILITIILLTFVVPKFAELFQHMSASLPLLTLGIIHLSSFLSHYGFLFLWPILAIFLLWDSLKKSPHCRKMLEQVFIKLAIFQKMKLTHFARNLSTTLAAGIPIIEALQLTARTTGSVIYENAITHLRLNLMKGHSLYQMMYQIPYFPPLLVQMVKIGEESGSLEHILEKVVELYESDIEHFISKLSQMLEPLIMVVLGVLIGGLVIAMYLPIFKLGTAL